MILFFFYVEKDLNQQKNNVIRKYFGFFNNFYLSNATIDCSPKSRETIPLKVQEVFRH
jgi:hypothetical protein